MKFLSFAKILAMLLVSYSVSAKTGNATDGFEQNQSLKLTKAAGNLHKNMLQPHTVHVSILPEHSAKPTTPGYGILFMAYQSDLLLRPKAQATEILQDVDRCESVSRFLFPYHFFW